MGKNQNDIVYVHVIKTKAILFNDLLRLTLWWMW